MTPDQQRAHEIADAEWQKQFATLSDDEQFGRRHITLAGENCYLKGLADRDNEMIARAQRHSDDEDILQQQILALQDKCVAYEKELEEKDALIARLQDPQNPKHHK